MSRRPLYLTLQAQAADQWQIAYFDGLTHSTALPASLKKLRDVMAGGTHAQVQKLIRGLGGAGQGVGVDMFNFLFGKLDPPFWDSFFGVSGANPSAHPVRVCIKEEVKKNHPPQLEHLPWFLTRYQGQPLVGSHWTFETRHCAPGVAKSVALGRPGLLIAPPLDGEDPSVLNTLLQALNHSLRWAGQLKAPPCWYHATSLAEIENIWHQHRPQWVHFRGHGTIKKGDLYLDICNNYPSSSNYSLSLDKLREVWSSAPPLVAYFQACFSAGGGFSSPARQLLPDTPYVVTVASETHTGVSDEQAQIFWEGVLAGRQDPVEAANQTATTVLATIATAADKLTWSNQAPDYKDPLSLDRHTQRDAVTNTVQKAVRHPTPPRLLMFVAAGAPKNHLIHLGDQLFTELQGHLSECQIRHTFERKVAAPYPLAADPARTLYDAQKVPAQNADQWRVQTFGAPRGGQVDIGWLNWNVVPALAVKDLLPWVRAHIMLAKAGTPNDWANRLVVSFIAVEHPSEVAAEKWLRELALMGRDHRIPPKDPFYELHRLSLVDKVPFDQLLSFLLDDPSCPAGLAEELAEAISDATGNDYEATVALIAELQRNNGWYTFLSSHKVAP